MKGCLTLLSAALFAFSSQVAAETPERVLLPVVVKTVPGAYGSLWSSVLSVNNAGPSEVVFDAHEICVVAACPPARTILPEEGLDIPFPGQPGEAPGLIAFVEGERSGVTINLRIQDLSRAFQTWGTELPIVWESDLFTSPKRMLNVPTGPRFRSTLRIYGLADGPGKRFEVRAFDLAHSSTTLGRAVVTLNSPPNSQTVRQYKPSFFQFADVGTQFGITSDSKIGVEVIPLDGESRFWTFISVGNNETQHVTTIIPR